MQRQTARTRIGYAALAACLVTAMAAHGTAAAAEPQNCRWKANGTRGRTVLIDVPQGAGAATLSIRIDGRPDLDGAAPYTREQLVGLNTVVLILEHGGSPAFAIGPENDSPCMEMMISGATKAIDQNTR